MPDIGLDVEECQEYSENGMLVILKFFNFQSLPELQIILHMLELCTMKVKLQKFLK